MYIWPKPDSSKEKRANLNMQKYSSEFLFGFFFHVGNKGLICVPVYMSYSNNKHKRSVMQWDGCTAESSVYTFTELKFFLFFFLTPKMFVWFSLEFHWVLYHIKCGKGSQWLLKASLLYRISMDVPKTFILLDSESWLVVLSRNVRSLSLSF